MIIARKARRALFAALPAWLAAAVAFCAIVPGWIDDVPPLALAFALCLVQPVRIRRARSAWRGGKTERRR